MASIWGKSQETFLVHLLTKVEIALMKTVSVDDQPAQDRVQLFEHLVDAPAQPWNSCVRPSGAYMEHKDVTFTCPVGKLQKRIAAQPQCIQKCKRHRCAFVGKTSIFRLNVIEQLRQSVLVLVSESGAVAVKEDSPNIFQTSLDRGRRTDETTSCELYFTRINGQQS